MAVNSKSITERELLQYLKDKGIITDKMSKALLEGEMAFNFSARLIGQEGKKQVVVDFNYWDVETVTTD